MAYDVIPFKLNAKLRINAAISVEYPAGRTIENYENGTAHMVVSNKYGVLANGEGVDMALGYQSVTITNRTTSILAADTEILIQLDMGETDEATALSAPLILRTRGFLSVEERGVRPVDYVEDAVDQRFLLQTAINQARVEKRELILPEGIYGLAGMIGRSDRAVSLSMRGLGGGAKFYALPEFIAGGQTALLSFRPATFDVPSVAVTADIIPNRKTIDVASTAGMEVGMELCVMTTTNWYYDPRDMWFKGEQHEIAKIVSSTVVEIAGITRDYYDVSDETVTVRCWWPSTIKLDNLAFEYPIIPTAENDQARGGLSVYAARHLELNGIHTIGGGGPGIEARRCAHGSIENWSARRLGFETQGYGLAVFGGYGITARAFETYGLRRAFDASWFYAPARDMRVKEFVIYGGGYEGDGVGEFWPGGEDSFGIGSHGPCENLHISDGMVQNVRSAVTARGRSTVIENVDFVGRMEYPIQMFFGEGLRVSGCTYSRGDFPGALDPDNMPKGFVKLGASLGNALSRPIYGLPIDIVNNSVAGTDLGFVDLYNAGDVQRLTVRNNEVLASPAAAQSWRWLFKSGGTADVSASTIYGNDVSRMEGVNIIETFGPGITLSGAAALGRRVKTGERTALLRLGDDDTARALWLAEASLRGGAPVWVTVNGPTAATSGHFQILPDGTTGAGAAGADIETVNTALTGTSGTDGKITLSLGSADVRVENRSGAEITIEVSL